MVANLPDLVDERWQSARRILAVRLDNIGDVIMLGPALRLLRRTLPDARITLMATPGGSQVAPFLPWVDDVMVERVLWQEIGGHGPMARGRWTRSASWPWSSASAAGQFDAALIFTSFGQSPHPPAFVCYLAGVPLRVAQSKEFGGGLLTQWVRPRPDEIHQVDRNLHLLKSAGFEVGDEDTRLELRVPAEARATAEGLLVQAGVSLNEPFIAIAPGASAAARRYAPERYTEVAARLSAQGLRVVLLGSPREERAGCFAHGRAERQGEDRLARGPDIGGGAGRGCGAFRAADRQQLRPDAPGRGAGATDGDPVFGDGV